MTLAQRIAAARGQEPADLLLTNLQLVNVFTGEIYPTEIAVQGDCVIGTGVGYAAARTVDLGGRYVAPGLIDAHVHIESSMCTPLSFAYAALTHGVTSVITDPHEIANVHGLDGVRYMLASAQGSPLSMFVMAPSCVPATDMETSGASLSAADLQTLLDHPAVLGLAEMMNFPGVVYGDPGVLDKIAAFSGRVLDGHCPGLTGHNLNAYITSGIGSDHECTTVEEAREKLRQGLVILIREATNAHNLHALLPLVTPENSRRLCWCTDDREPADLLDEGSIDHNIRLAIAGGLDPVTAIRMGTLNTAEYFRLHNRGVVAPGRRADLLVFSDLRAPQAEQVYSGGRLVVQDGAPCVEITAPQVTPLPCTMNIKWDSVNFDLPARGSRVHVIGSIPDQVVTEKRVEEAKIENGFAVADPARDILKMAVIERHHATGNIGKGFIQGIGLKRGAMAGTVAHDHHNLVAIGADDVSMMAAARAVERMGGGLVAVEGEHVLAELPLPVAGLMSDQPIQTVRAGLDHLLDAAHNELGSTLHDPFMAASFMALEVIPSLKLTDRGLVDVDRFEIIDLFV
ncbi:MAG TPA: adenine deaminase [Aggregatilineaceae bacterium]|nr:adenine deaminase [Aggregatilineaceae bacterium]